MGLCSSADASDPAALAAKRAMKAKNEFFIQTLFHSLENPKDLPLNSVDTKCAINCMAVAEDQTMIVTGSDDGTVKVWTTQTQRCECFANLGGHRDYINSVLMQTDKDGKKWVISASADKTIKKWDVENRECSLTLDGHGSVVNRLICTGDVIFSSSYDKTARCWDFDTGYCIRVFSGHKRGVYPLIFIPDFTPEQEDEDAAAANKNFNMDGDRDLLLTGSADFTARAWSFETGRTVAKYEAHTGAITTMATDEKGKILYTGATDWKVFSWNIITGAKLQEFEGHSNSIVCLAVKNKILYTGSSDNSCRAWVTEFGECTRIYKGFKHVINCLKVSSGLLFTGCGDGAARVFDAKSGALKRQYDGHLRAVNTLQIVTCELEKDDEDEDEFKPNVITDQAEEKAVAIKLFTGSYDGTMRVWDASGFKDETVFGKDDEEKSKKEKEKAKRKKAKMKEQQQKLKKIREAEMIETGKQKITIEDEQQYGNMVDDMQSGAATAGGGQMKYGGIASAGGDKSQMKKPAAVPTQNGLYKSGAKRARGPDPIPEANGQAGGGDADKPAAAPRRSNRVLTDDDFEPQYFD